MKKIITTFLIIAALTGCHNEELEKLKKENIELKAVNTELKVELDSIKTIIKEEEERKSLNLAGKVYWSTLGPDKPLYELNFLENNKVSFYLDNFGTYSYPYSNENGIITIKIISNLSLRLQIINKKQLKLLQSSIFGDKKVEGVIYNLQN